MNLKAVKISELPKTTREDLNDDVLFVIADETQNMTKAVRLSELRDYLVYGPGSPVRKSDGGYDNEIAKQMIERIKKLTRQK